MCQIKPTPFFAILTLALLALAGCKPETPSAPQNEPSKPTPSASIVIDSELKDILNTAEEPAPMVIEFHPAAGTEVSADDPIEIRFDQPMDQTSVEKAFQVLSATGDPVRGRFQWVDSQALRFQPLKPLLPGSTYRVVVSTAATSSTGFAMADDFDTSILTKTPLQVTRVFPSNGATEIEINSQVTVMFNRPVVELMTAEQQLNLPQPLLFDPPVKGKGEWINTSVYVFTPESPLRTGTQYNITIPAGLTTADASADTAIQQAYRWQFTTLPPRAKEVRVEKTSILPGQDFVPTNVPLIPNITFLFEQAMDPAATGKAVYLKEAEGSLIPLRYRWEKDGKELVISPLKVLKMGMPYHFGIGSQARAVDGGTLEDDWILSLLTIPPPAIDYIGSGTDYREFAARQFVIDFASPMNIETIDSRLTFSPPLKETNWYYNETDYSVTYYGLEPSTDYRVTALAGMRDIYGNAINQAVSTRFTTEPYEPFITLEMPYYQAVMRAGAPQTFYVQYTNINTIDFKLFELSEEKLLRYERDGFDLEKNLPPASRAIWTHREKGQGVNDQTVYSAITLSGNYGAPLETGIYLLTMDSPDVPHQGTVLDGRVVIVASAHLTFKQSAQNGLLWLTDLNSGKPLSDVFLKVVDISNRKIVQGKTDPSGLMTFELPDWENEYNRPAYYSMTSADGLYAFTGTNMYSGVSPEDFGIWSNYYSLPQDAVAYIYTDRPLYRPDQPVYFKGIVRLDRDMEYQLPIDQNVEVVISSYQEEVYRERLELSDFGTFDGKMILDSNAALGSYTILVQSPETEIVIGSGYFTVAEYRKPEFIVNATAKPEDVQVGGDFQAVISAEYYSGGALKDAEVDWNLQSDPASFSPPEAFSAYSFEDYPTGTQDFNEASVPREISQGSAVTGADGIITLTLPADPQSINPTRRLSLNVTVTDFAGTSVSGQAVVTAHRSQVYAGIRPTSYIGQVGKEQVFDLAALDWDGKPISGQLLEVVFSERQWFSVQQQDAQGVLRWVSTTRDNKVENQTGIKTDQAGRAVASFVPPKGGYYRVQVKSFDRTGKLTSASAFLWVAGEGYIPWRQVNDRTFQMVPDKESYQPGDTAKILIATPFQGEVYALITVERGLIRDQEVVRLTSNSTVYNLPVAADMAPSVYISAVAVKGIDDTNPRPDFKMGMARLDVSTQQQQLAVELTPDKPNASPGDKVTYDVVVKDAAGSPVQAEVSLALTDLAVLNLSEPNSGPLIDYFYYRRSLQVSTAMSMSLNLEEFNEKLNKSIAEGENAGSGGGKGEGLPGIPEVRKNFPDTAYWKADLTTNKNGHASVSFVLPDNLTTWRMDARAVTEETRVGQVTSDLVSTRPLLIRPQTPRFLVNGDNVVFGAGVHNNTGKDLTVEVTLEAGGITLLDPISQTRQVKNGQQVYVSWKAEVPLDSTRADLVFSVSGGAYQDSSKPTLGTLDDQGTPVYRYQAFETVSTSGDLTAAGSRTEAIRLPANLNALAGSLNIEVAPSLAAGLKPGLAYLEHYPYECTEQTVSRFLPNILTTRALRAAGVSNPGLETNLRDQVNTALQRLYNQQNEDGGWGWWSGNQSQPLTSAYVVLGMIEARSEGYLVSPDVLTRGMLYIFTESRSLQQNNQNYTAYGMNTQAFILYVLALGGEPAVSDSVRLYDYRTSLSLDGRAFLAQALYLTDPDDPRVSTLLSDLVDQAALSASGAHWQNLTRDYWNWGSDTRTTAIILDTLLKIDPENPLIVQGVRWLMKNRTAGRWGSTQETAWTLMALTAWMEETGELEGAYNYALTLNGAPIGQGQAAPASIDQVQTFQIAIEDLLTKDLNRLVFARTEGPGSLYYTADLNLALPAENLPALDNGIIISRKYYPLDDSGKPITSASQGDLIQGRLTIVVPQDTHYLIVEDPLPAGLEGIDTSLKTSPRGKIPEKYNWSSISSSGWGWWFFDHVELRDEKLVISAEYLPAGTYVYTYLARAGSVGSFQAIPPTAQEFYFPDVYGRGEGSRFEVRP